MEYKDRSVNYSEESIRRQLEFALPGLEKTIEDLEEARKVSQTFLRETVFNI